MTTLVIRTRNSGRGFTGNGNERGTYEFEGTTQYENGGGYSSVKEVQKELMRRFPDGIRNRRTRKIVNGLVRVEGNRNNRVTQVITWKSPNPGEGDKHNA